MTVLLEIRDKMKMIYGKYEAFIFPAVKFLIAFVVLLTLNSKMGYMTKLDNIAIVLIVALMCSFLPTGCILLIAALISLLHMYALSMEVAIVGVCFYLIMYLVFFRFRAVRCSGRKEAGSRGICSSVQACRLPDRDRCFLRRL